MKNLYQDSVSHQMYREAPHWEGRWQWATNYCGDLVDTENVVSAIEKINKYRERGLEITEEDIMNRTPFLLDPEYLITCSMETHNAIHFGDITVSRIAKDPVIRTPNDQVPWLH